MAKSGTQKIPAWSRQITANGPECMAQAFSRQAAALGISTGELLRQLWMIGAKDRFPKLARQLIASHRKYYPSRAIMAGAVLLLSWGFCATGNLVLARHHHDLRTAGRVVRSAKNQSHVKDFEMEF